MEIKVKTTTVKHCELRIDDYNLRMMLAAIGHNIPPSAKIVFRIPGGADWSSTEVDIDFDTPIIVRWDETEEQ